MNKNSGKIHMENQKQSTVYIILLGEAIEISEFYGDLSQ